MPATLGGQITLLIGIFTLVGFAWSARRVYAKHIITIQKKAVEEKQHQEWLELFILCYAQATGYRIPQEVIERHRRINGNERLPDSLKDLMYGKDRTPSDDKHTSARSLGLVKESEDK